MPDEPWTTGRDLAHELRQHTLRERVGLDLVRLDQRAKPRLVADVAADRALHEPRQAELREAAIGEVADADDAHGRQVARPPVGGEDGGELVDEALRQGMSGPRAADEDGAPISDQRLRVADVDDLRHGM